MTAQLNAHQNNNLFGVKFS